MGSPTPHPTRTLAAKLAVAILGGLVALVCATSTAWAQTDDPCLTKLADDPDRLDQYDALVQEYLDASAASNSEKQVELLDEIIGVCDANLRLWVFRANAYATLGECDKAVDDFQFVLENADGWWAAENAADAKKRAEEGMERHAPSCRAMLKVKCEDQGATVQVGDGEAQPCPAKITAVPGKTTFVYTVPGKEPVELERELVAGTNEITLPKDASAASADGGGSEDGGTEGDGSAEVEPSAPSKYSIQLGIAVGGGGGVGELSSDEINDSGDEPEGGVGGGARVYALFRFLSFMAAGVNFGITNWEHEDDEFGGTYEARVPSFGAMVRFQVPWFAAHIWTNLIFGSLDFRDEGFSSGSDIGGLEAGVGAYLSIALGSIFFLEFGPHIVVRTGKGETDSNLLAGLPSLEYDYTQFTFSVVAQGTFDIGL